jgi:Fic family protein
LKPITKLSTLRSRDFETTAILKAAVGASRKLAELKGVADTIPNQGILINTLAMQEAKDSSAIENIITTHDELFKSAVFPEASLSTAAKEVRSYVEALRLGHDSVRTKGLLSNAQILDVQATIERNNAGFRKLPGTVLKNNAGRTVYTPPQEHADILDLMKDLESFINDETRFDADPLVKMAIVHHQFESIHPFYDGNGRTGRIMNVLYLVLRDLLDIPVLYLSRHIVRTKSDYYRLLQHVRETGEWEDWILYMLTAVEKTSEETIATIGEIRSALMRYKHQIRQDYKFYSQDLVNNLFQHPYTKIDFVMRDVDVSRITATKYLDALAESGLLQKVKFGRANYYMNVALVRILVGAES